MPIVLVECFLQRMKLTSVCKAFDRGDLSAFAQHSEAEAAIYSCAIHQYSAGAT